MSSLTRRATKSASTKRAVVASGKRQNPTAHLTGLACTNLWPADISRLGQLVEAGLLESLVNIYETILVGNHDIKPGDLLVVDSVEYVIRGAAQWDYPTGTSYFTHLTVERILQ